MALWLFYAAGLSTCSCATMLFAPGILVYLMARRQERGAAHVHRLEAVIAAGVLLAACGLAYVDRHAQARSREPAAERRDSARIPRTWSNIRERRPWNGNSASIRKWASCRTVMVCPPGLRP